MNNSCKTHNLIVNGTFCDEVRAILNDVRSIRDSQNSSESILSALQVDNKSLWRDVAILRSQHHKQRRVIEKLIQFLLSLIQNRNNMVTKKRKVRIMINTATGAVMNAGNNNKGELTAAAVGMEVNGGSGMDIKLSAMGVPISPQDVGALIARSTSAGLTGHSSVMGSPHEPNHFMQSLCQQSDQISGGCVTEMVGGTDDSMAGSQVVSAAAATAAATVANIGCGSSLLSADEMGVVVAAGHLLRGSQPDINFNSNTNNNNNQQQQLQYLDVVTSEGGSQQQPSSSVLSQFSNHQPIHHFNAGILSPIGNGGQLHSPGVNSANNSENINSNRRSSNSSSNGNRNNNTPNGSIINNNNRELNHNGGGNQFQRASNQQLPVQFTRNDGESPALNNNRNRDGGGVATSRASACHVTQWTANSIYNTMTDHVALGGIHGMGGVFSDLRASELNCLGSTLDVVDQSVVLSGQQHLQNQQPHQHHQNQHLLQQQHHHQQPQQHQLHHHHQHHQQQLQQQQHQQQQHLQQQQHHHLQQQPCFYS